MGVPKYSPVDPFDESKGYYSFEEERRVKMPRAELLALVADLEAETSRLRATVGVAWGMYNREESLLIKAIRGEQQAQAQNEARAAALRDLLEDGRLSATTHDGIRAALSLDAGKGWVPPEVREQVREALSDLLDYLKDPANPKPGKGAKNVLRKARAALDRLGVV